MKRRSLSPPDAARRRFIIIQTVVLLAFGVVTMATTRMMPHVEAPLQRWLFAAGPIALLVLWAWEFFKMIRADDEMMQTLHLRAVALSAGLVLLAATLWDVAARLLGLSGIPTYWLLPAFALLYSCALPVLMRRA